MQMWIVRRRKFGGSVWHYGVILPSGVVIEFSELGLRFLSSDDFAAGQDVQHFRPIPPGEYRRVEMRIAEFRRNPRAYDLAKWNCENFANWLAGDAEPKSAQVQIAAGIAALLGLAWLFTRLKSPPTFL